MGSLEELGFELFQHVASTVGSGDIPVSGLG